MASAQLGDKRAPGSLSRGKRTIWLIYSSKKGGHKYPAEALAQYLKRECPQFRPLVINLFSFSKTLSFFDALGRFGDLHLPSLWRACARSMVHRKSLFTHLYRGILKLIVGLSHSKKFLLHQTVFGGPSLIISFQPELNICAPLFKRWFSSPIYSIVIDLLIHDLWVEKDIDRYYVPNETAKEELEKWGIPKERIIVSGLPLREGFIQVGEKSIPELKRKWRVPNDKPCLILIAGLLGKMIDFAKAIKSIGEVPQPLTIIMVFGENSGREIDRKKLAKHCPAHHTLIPLGRIEEIEEIMAIADIIITKPGSGTISEAVALGKPLILITPTGGAWQDIRFAQLLEEMGIGIWVKETEEIGSKAQGLLKDRALSKKLREKTKDWGERNLEANKIITETLEKDYQIGKI